MKDEMKARVYYYSGSDKMYIKKINVKDDVIYATTARKQAKVFNFDNAVAAQMFLEKGGDVAFKEYVL